MWWKVTTRDAIKLLTGLYSNARMRTATNHFQHVLYCSMLFTNVIHLLTILTGMDHTTIQNRAVIIKALTVLSWIDQNKSNDNTK